MEILVRNGVSLLMMGSKQVDFWSFFDIEKLRKQP